MLNVYALAADAASKDLTFAERAQKAGIVSLQGMVTIFLVLAILWGAIELMHYLLVGRKEAAKKAVTETPAPASPAAEVAPTPAPAPAPVVSGDDAIVAAITAAISAQLSSEGYTGGFRVVSFKRVTASRKKRF